MEYSKEFSERYSRLLFASLAVLICSSLIFYRIYLTSDIVLHAGFAVDHIVNNKPLSTNFIYYILIIFFGGLEHIKMASIVILSLAVVAKFLVTYRYFVEQAASNITANKIYVLAFMILIMSPIYLPQLVLYHRFYIGSFPLNIWHNSTIISVMPFVVLLFWQTCKQFESWSASRLYVILFLIIINLLIKPSYIFVYIIALPITAIIQKRNIVKSLFISLFSISLIFIQYYYQYLVKNRYDTEHSIIISPFLVYMNSHWLNQYWSNYSMSIVVALFISSVVFSLLLPLYVLAKRGAQDVSLVLSTVSMVFALLISVLLAESGPRLNHGNFFWQVFACAFVFFLATISKILPELSQKPIIIFQKYGIKLYQLNMFQNLFLLHFAFGFVYIFRLLILQTYI